MDNGFLTIWADAFPFYKEVFLQSSEGNAGVGVDAFYNVFVVVVGLCFLQVKVCIGMATKSGKCGVQPFRPVQLVGGCGLCVIGGGCAALPVGHDVQPYFRLGTVFHAWHDGIPPDRGKLDEYSRTLPALFLFDKLHVVVPQIDVANAVLQQQGADGVVQFFSEIHVRHFFVIE